MDKRNAKRKFVDSQKNVMSNKQINRASALANRKLEGKDSKADVGLTYSSVYKPYNKEPINKRREYKYLEKEKRINER